MKSLPFISVVLPIRNEAPYIEKVLGALLQQDYPKDKFEIIIADGMSDDGTRAVIGNLLNRSKHHPPVEIIDNPKRIVPTGLNAAIRMAKGDLIVRVDGHAIPAIDYLKACVEVKQQTHADNVGGPIICIGTNWMSSAIALATSKPYGVGNSAFRTSTRAQYADTVPFGAWNRSLFERIGLFNEHFVRHQDYEFNHRTRANGGKIYLSPRIQSHYFVRANLRKLARQYFQYGTWKGKMLKIFPGSLKWRHTVPPVFVLSCILLPLLSLFLPILWMLTFAVFGLYACFLVVATVLSCGKEGWRYAPGLPIIFMLLHFSWGLGFWWGLPRKLPPNFNELPPTLEKVTHP